MTPKPVGNPAEPQWIKSSYSASNSNDCVEIATAPGTVHVRDSKDPQGPQFAFTSQAWAEFVVYAANS